MLGWYVLDASCVVPLAAGQLSFRLVAHGMRLVLRPSSSQQALAVSSTVHLVVQEKTAHPIGTHPQWALKETH